MHPYASAHVRKSGVNALVNDAGSERYFSHHFLLGFDFLLLCHSPCMRLACCPRAAMTKIQVSTC